MKYIDSEKLIAEIERYENTAIDAYNPLGEDADSWHGRVVACEDLKTFITSLQQEQPEADLDKLVNEEFASHSRTTEYGLEVTYNRAELYQLIKRMALVFNARKEK